MRKPHGKKKKPSMEKKIATSSDVIMGWRRDGAQA